MSDAATKYRENEAKLLAMPTSDDVSLTEELKTLRRLMAEAVADPSMPGRHAVIRDYAKCVTSISQAERSRRLMMSETLERKTVLSVAEAIIDVVIDELKSIEGYEEIVDRIVERCGSAIAEAKNRDSIPR